jgi:hypothetical protein
VVIGESPFICGGVAMKKLLLSGLLFAAMSSAALAAEPLTEQQMDGVTAGVVMVLGPFNLIHVNANGTFTIDQFFVVRG